MKQVRLLDGRTFQIPTSFSLAEVSWCERAAKVRASDWMMAEELCSGILLTLRRNQIMVGWGDVWEDLDGEYTVEDVEDPTMPGQPEAAGGSTSGETPTSSASPTTSVCDPPTLTP